MEDATIYRKTDKGRQEIADRSFGLESHVRRLLVMIDGQRDAVELSVYVRAGELESTLERLVAEGFVESVDRDRVAGRVALTPAANDPVVFAGIKIRAMTEIRSRIRGRLGPMADLLVAEINGCSSALELRAKLRKLEGTLVQLMGQADGVELARRIGNELTRLVPART
ncbi:MAG TPA: hypothetical protein VFI80_12055 [Burkholderiales bacterium]|nr:hypothetical protein [Burkholderiales bacterium]